MPSRKSRLLALNDVRLAAYLSASDEKSRSQELERLLTGEVQPRAATILETYRRAEWPIERPDFEDIMGQVTLSVLRKLRASTVLEEESIQNLEAYVVTLTRNAVRDFMRRRSPERTRMKSRMRYLFTHDDRLALWIVDAVTFCGLAGWRDTTSFESDLRKIRAQFVACTENAQAAAEGIIRGFRAIGRTVRLGDLVAALLPEPLLSAERALVLESGVAPRDPVETRQYLRILWSEIRELPPRQQTALLLNLREPGSGNAVLLFVAVGIATIEEIAAAVEMSNEALAEIWDQLPFDDLRIAEHLSINRQQVINLRKSARERLTRRMILRGRGRQ